MNDLSWWVGEDIPRFIYYGASLSGWHIYDTPPLEPPEADRRIEACGSAAALVELYEFDPMNSASRATIATLLL